MSIPYVPQGTSKRFYVPRTLAADFTAFLNQDIPNTVMNFTVLKDWYDQFEDGYEPSIIRGELYPDTTKSRYENTDNNLNIRCDINSGIRKGDMLVEEDGTIYILDWEVHLESNNAPSRAVRCNMILNIKRWQDEEVDENGFVIYESEPGWKTIVDNLPINAYRYDGRPEYSAVAGTPGLSPNALTRMTVQYNAQTKQIVIGDKFVWGDVEYEIVDINYNGYSYQTDSGTLNLQARKAAGGMQ